MRAQPAGMSEQSYRRMVERSFFRHHPDVCIACAMKVMRASSVTLAGARADAAELLRLHGSELHVLLPPGVCA